MSTESHPKPKRKHWTYKRIFFVFILPSVAAFAVFSQLVMPGLVRAGLENTYEMHQTLKNVYGITNVTWTKYGGMYATTADGKDIYCVAPSGEQLDKRVEIKCDNNVTLIPKR